MDVRALFDKEFLYHYDLQGADRVVTIAKVVQGTLTNKTKKTKKPVVYFKGKEKGLALNITNVKAIGGMYGYKVEDWIDKRITLYPTTCQFGSDTVECIRVRPTKPGAKAVEMPPDPPAPEEREAGDDDDEGAIK